MNETITIDQMHQAVVGGSTYKNYKYEIWKILQHGKANHNELKWLTPIAKTRLGAIETDVEGIQGKKAQAKCKWELLMEFLLQCDSQPISVIHNLTPESYMQYLQAPHDKNGSLLKTKAYAVKTASLHHLF